MLNKYARFHMHSARGQRGCLQYLSKSLHPPDIDENLTSSSHPPEVHLEVFPGGGSRSQDSQE